MSEHQGDRLLALGSNGSYQLGLGHDVDVDTPTQVHLPHWEAHHRIEAVASGGNHSLILRSDGAVFGTGRNAENQLGISNCATIEDLRQLPVPASVKYVAAGWAFSVVVTGNGDIYTTGYGDKGELGQGDGVQNSTTWKKLELPTDASPLKSISAGPHHVIVICGDASPTVFGWGAGRKGQLGQPAEKAIWAPRLIDTSTPYEFISCGRDFTVLSGETMCLNVIGSDRLKGQSLQFPKGIDGITTLQAGWSSVHALFSNGSVTGWGNNSHGQILENANKHGKFNMISAGSEHCLAVVNSEIVDGWGWGEHGNLGPERDTSSLREVYRAIQGEYIVAVYGGCANSWFVLRDKLHAKG